MSGKLYMRGRVRYPSKLLRRARRRAKTTRPYLSRPITSVPGWVFVGNVKNFTITPTVTQ